jgi:hypothetical protein
LYFWRSSEAARGAQRPIWHGNKTNKAGASSARARTRGQNPLVVNSVLIKKDKKMPIERGNDNLKAEMLVGKQKNSFF